MLDLTNVTDDLVAAHLARTMVEVRPGSDSWRVLGFCNEARQEFSFCATRTYPRPDHPDPKKRLPLVYLMVGILVSLRTTLENEQKAMAKLIERFPTEGRLLAAEPSEIAECIVCAGMSQTKSIRIRKALDYIATIPGGLNSLADLPVDAARSRLLEIPGFGPKSADCMLTIGLGIPSMVVDVNVFRVSSSLLGSPWAESPDYSNAVQVRAIKDQLDAIVGRDVFLCQIVHTYLLMHGKRYRLRGHDASDCRLGKYCRSCEADTLKAA